MRVVIVGGYPLDDRCLEGGVQAAFAYLVGELRQQADLDLHVLALGSAALQQYERSQRDGFTLHLLPPYPRFEFSRDYRRYQVRFDEALGHIRPDVVHAQDAAQDAYVALRSGYPTVITVHGIRQEDGKYLASALLRLRNRIHSARIENYNLRRTGHLIAISRYVTGYFVHMLRPETKVYHIPNAVNHSFFGLPREGDGRTVLYMGRIIRRKRPIDLVRAFAEVVRRVPRAQLRIAGELRSDARYAASVRACIQRLGLSESILLLGPLSEGEVLKEYARCDVVALPSAQETAPMVIAQAMAAGKPVVATTVGGIPEMVSHGQTGFLFEVGDVGSLAGALLGLLQQPSLRAGMGRAGRQKAEASYRAAIVAGQTYQVYQGIAGGR